MKYSGVQSSKHANYFFFPNNITSSILSAMFTGVCGLPEKLSLASVKCSHVLCISVKLAWKCNADDGRVKNMKYISEPHLTVLPKCFLVLELVACLM